MRVIFIFLIITFSSCIENNEDPLYLQLDVVTGLLLSDINGIAVGKWQDSNDSPGEVIVYPIPATNEIFISTRTKIIRIWLIKGNCQSIELPDDFKATVENHSYRPIDLDLQNVFPHKIKAFEKDILLDLSFLEKGLYKLFYETESNNIHWRTIYIDPKTNLFPDLNFTKGLCN